MLFFFLLKTLTAVEITEGLLWTGLHGPFLDYLMFLLILPIATPLTLITKVATKVTLRREGEIEYGLDIVMCSGLFQFS